MKVTTTTLALFGLFAVPVLSLGPLALPATLTAALQAATPGLALAGTITGTVGTVLGALGLKLLIKDKKKREGMQYQHRYYRVHQKRSTDNVEQMV